MGPGLRRDDAVRSADQNVSRSGCSNAVDQIEATLDAVETAIDIVEPLLNGGISSSMRQLSARVRRAALQPRRACGRDNRRAA